ncbi:hypothetical protein Lal_00024527 [Lupinus albus]|uniref:Uncharacterized protein n=1 Tax=Lupinus albus TaxID=3870 RepID=A0A6A4PXS9_LUPAL|nr:hypothetical protein Lalb_Chr10g0106131 [Lupinus albus]KAF1889205.1 hypothetical protein Lal_00024527 [Lupinus albus]
MHDLCLEKMRLMSLACCSVLLLLVMFMLKISFAATDESTKFQSIRARTMPKLNPSSQAKEGSRKNRDEEGSEKVIGDEKRRIYTGPNPLHNR